MFWICILPAFGLFVVVYSLYKTYLHAYDLNHPRRLCLEPNVSVPAVYRKFDFKTTDGLNLKGIDVKPKMATQGTILLCHYLGGSKEMVLSFTDCLLKAGFRLFAFDFRNHGESREDRRMKFLLREDFFAFYEYIEKTGIKGPFGIMGFSMGATPALFGYSRYSDIKAAVVDSGPLIFVKKYFRYILDNKKIRHILNRVMFLLIFLYHAGFDKMSGETIDVLNKLKGKPVLFIHGSKDNIIPIENAKVAYNHIKSEKSFFWEIPNSRHLTNCFLKREEYEKRIVEFFVCNIGDDGGLNEKSRVDFA